MAKAKPSMAKSASRKRTPARTAPTPRGVSARPAVPTVRMLVPAATIDTLAYAKALIRNVPDFPRRGVLFKDITPLLADPKGFHIVLDALAERFIGEHVDAIVGIESRGFIFGAALADRLGVGFVPVRKTGKLPYKTTRETYALEYGSDTLEMHEDAVNGRRCLIVDDLLATGGTAAATARLVERQGGSVEAFAFVIELDFLSGRQKLGGRPLHSLLHYVAGSDGETARPWRSRGRRAPAPCSGSRRECPGRSRAGS